MPESPAHVFVMFSLRALLDIGDNEASQNLAAETVTHRQRVLIAVHNNVLITAAPSEPLLAVVCAVEANKDTSTFRVAFYTLVHELVLKDIAIDRGRQGGLCTRLLFLQSRDRAAVKDGKLFGFVWGNAVRAVTLREVLVTMLGPDFGLNPQQKSGNLELLQILETFLSDDLWVNFTHFIQLDIRLADVSLEMLRDLWAVGAAVQCAHNQPGIGSFIPAYRGDLNAPVQLENFELMAAQTRAETVAALSSTIKDFCNPPLYHAELRTAPYKCPHLVIFMDLGTTTEFQEGGLVELTHGIPVSGHHWKDLSPGSEPERLCLNVRGHSKITYPVIEPVANLFALLFEKTVNPWSSGGLEKNMVDTFSPLGMTVDDPLRSSG